MVKGLLKILSIIGVISCVGGAWNVAEAGTKDVSIAELVSDPWAYHEQKVRVRGIVGYCVTVAHCSLCSSLKDHTTDEDDAACISASITQFGSYPSSKQEEIDPDFIVMRRHAQFGSRMLQTAEVTLEGSFDASCSGIPEDGITEERDSDGNIVAYDIFVVCSDYPSDLDNVSIVDIHKWWPQQLWPIGPDDIRLRPAAASETLRLRELFGAADITSYGSERVEELEIFTAEPDDWVKKEHPEIERYGVGCYCSKDECTSFDWPRALSQTENMISNPYVCHHATRINRKWIVQLDFRWR